ncbi:putative short chain dehydrogenase/reductase [Mycena pura]|uniref:Short chain dehydrogenase/reductase n=1 Tax=Mycena pura TaxID=153505 RepID=A0AAD6VE20_9AGAR|nr:putative short chain dehydrogenase/reductase [Mycena pura]
MDTIPQPVLLSVLVVGFVTSAVLLTRFGVWVWCYILRPSSLPRYLHGETTPWALVTGASDGIGKGFAKELLAAGFNVILHGRNPTKLANLKREFAARYPNREIDIAVADVSAAGSERAVVKVVGDRRLTVLVNNVGGHPGGRADYRSLEDFGGEDLDLNINMNARFPAQLTRQLIPVLRKNQPSLIINIGSLGAVSAPPYLTIYSGTKAFNKAFSYSLCAELRHDPSTKDIEVLFIQVGEVVSNTYLLSESLVSPSAERFAKAALNRVGCGYLGAAGWIVHSMQEFAFGWTPEFLAIKTVTDVIVRNKHCGRTSRWISYGYSTVFCP